MKSFSKILESAPLFLAPMEGITNSIFRKKICDVGGVDIVATEFVRITGAKQKVRPFVRHDNTPLQIQIMGTSPEIVGDCISFLKDKGVLFDDDWLDLNVGCPSKRVNASGAGAALLLEPEKLLLILQKMRASHSGVLSMKTRIGYQSDLDFPRLLSFLSNAPIDFLTLHARTKCAGYDEPVNLKFLAQAVKVLPFPVIGNGDLWTPQDMKKMFDETGVAGLMCGRGAITDPFLFKDFKNGDLIGRETEERRRELFDFTKTLLEEYSQNEPKPNTWLGRTKEYLTWFSKHPLVGRELFQRIKRKQDIAAILEELGEYRASL